MKFEDFKSESFKRKFIFFFFVHNLMIRWSKIGKRIGKIIPKKALE